MDYKMFVSLERWKKSSFFPLEKTGGSFPLKTARCISLFSSPNNFNPILCVESFWTPQTNDSKRITWRKAPTKKQNNSSDDDRNWWHKRRLYHLYHHPLPSLCYLGSTIGAFSVKNIFLFWPRTIAHSFLTEYDENVQRRTTTHSIKSLALPTLANKA